MHTLKLILASFLWEIDYLYLPGQSNLDKMIFTFDFLLDLHINFWFYQLEKKFHFHLDFEDNTSDFQEINLPFLVNIIWREKLSLPSQN